MYHLHYLTVLLLSGRCLAQFSKEDVCKPGLHTELSDTYRSTGFDTRTTDTIRCDNTLRRGWYKFTGVGRVAVEMATSCPGTDTCGTKIPIWLNGKHPAVKDNIVSVPLCGKSDINSPDCCQYKDELFVKNCGGFYIYYLNPTLTCPSAYCAGSAKRCPVDTWSDTGFEPCRGSVPLLPQLPVVKGPIVKPDQSFLFQCEFVYGPSDVDQVFEVFWTLNNYGDSNIGPQKLIGGQRVATLSDDKLANYIDKNVRCQVGAYYLGLERNAKVYTSLPNYFGVQGVTLSGPRLQGTKSFDFVCEVTVGSTDPNQRIEVVWTFDGKQAADIAPRIISGSRQATLDGRALVGRLNTNVGCEARLVFEKQGIKTLYQKSNTYFAGIQVSPGRLDIKDTEGQKDLTVTSTIPVVCDNRPNCCLDFTLTVDQKTVVSIKDTCSNKICASDWDDEKKQASFTVTVVPSRTSIGGISRQAVLTFGEITISETGQYLGIFTGYKPAPVAIVVTLETGFKCSMTGDPHFTGFDYKNSYHLYQTGDYIAYAVQNRDFVVQIRTYQCGGTVTCICGVVVREKNDIIRLHGCNNPSALRSSTIEIPYTLSEGTVVSRSADNSHVGILLPSGSEIKIDIGFTMINVYIQTPAYDRNQARGICGTNDGIPGNDFTHSDGTVSPVCPGFANCIPVAFTESWRVEGAASLFVVVPNKIEEKPPAEYCSCSVNALGKSEYICSPRQHIQDSKLTCTNCPVVTGTIKPSPPWGQPGNKEPVYVHIPVPPADPNKQWPNDKGITEAQANAMCLQAVQKARLYTRCKDVGNVVANAMTECLGDILFGGLTAPLEAITTSVSTNCLLILVEDQKNFVQTPDGGLKFDPELTEPVCLPECTEHGTCGQDRKCECQVGWAGETCQIDTTKGPIIKAVNDGDVCFVSDPTCQTFDFSKTNVDINDKMKCRLQPVTLDRKKNGQAVIVDAINESATKFTCPLPKAKNSLERYVISATSDGVKYSNEVPVKVYDTSCMSCVGKDCKIKNKTCRIKNTCYQDGEKNKENPEKVCDANKNKEEWS